MGIVYAVHSPAPGVARIRLRIDGLDGDVLAAVPGAWARAGDILLLQDVRTGGRARIAAEDALNRHLGATVAIVVHPDGYVIADRAKTVSMAVKSRRSEQEDWTSRLRAVSGSTGVGVAPVGVKGLSFGEMAGAFLLSAALQLDVAERGQDLGGVVRGIECSHRS